MSDTDNSRTSTVYFDPSEWTDVMFSRVTSLVGRIASKKTLAMHGVKNASSWQWLVTGAQSAKMDNGCVKVVVTFLRNVTGWDRMIYKREYSKA